MCKSLYSKAEIKTKVDSYMPCEAMAHSPKLLQVVIPSWYHTIPSVPIIHDVKLKSPWYISLLTSRTTILPSCSNFKVLLTLIFLMLISKTNILGEVLKLIGCIIAEKHWGHLSWVSCFKSVHTC